jgi:hypothetical protein
MSVVTAAEEVTILVNPVSGASRQVGPPGLFGSDQFRWWGTRRDFIWGTRYSFATGRTDVIYMAVADGVVHHWYWSPAGEYPQFGVGFRADGSPIVVNAIVGGADADVVAVPEPDSANPLVAHLPTGTFQVVPDENRVWLTVGPGTDLWLADESGIREAASGYAPLEGCV